MLRSSMAYRVEYRVLGLALILVVALASSVRAEAIDAEIDLGLVPDDATAATTNTATLNAFFATPEVNYQPLFVPGKRFYINDEIVIPQRNGAMVIQGVGGLSMAYTQPVGATTVGAVSTFTWVGVKKGNTGAGGSAKAMFRVNGALCKMEGIVLEGAKVDGNGGINDFPVANDRVAHGIIIEHPATVSGHSGKSVYRDMAFHFLNTGIKIAAAGTGDEEEHADENLFENLHFDSVVNPFLINNRQSIGNLFEHIVIYSNVEAGVHTGITPFDIRRGGQILIDGLTINGAGGTVFRLGDPGANDWFRRGGGQLTVRGLYIDSGTVSQGHTLARDFKLLEIRNPTVEADVDIQGTFSFDTTFPHLERAAVNAQMGGVTLSNPTASFTLMARRINMPSSLVVANGASEGVSLSAGGVLTVTVDISGGHNTVNHLWDVINTQAPEKYLVLFPSGGTGTLVAGTTTGSVSVVQLDGPIIVTRGSDSLIQLNINNLDAVNAAKYPRLPMRPLYSTPHYTDGVHDYPTFMQPEVMPDILPSEAVQKALEGSLLWLEARRIDATAAATNVVSGAVATWPDLSDSNNHMTAASGNRPLLHRNLINHRVAAHFENPSNVDDYLEKTSPSGFTTGGGANGPTDLTFYIVYLPNDFANDQTLVSMATHPSQHSFKIKNIGGTVGGELSTDGSNTITINNSDDLLLDSPNLIIVSRNAAAGTITMVVNGKKSVQTGVTTAALHKSTASLKVSGYTNSGTVVEEVRGAIAAVVIDDSGTIDEDIADYLRAVYGCN